MSLLNLLKNNKRSIVYTILFLSWLFESLHVICRSVHRPSHAKKPLLEVSFLNKPKNIYSIRDTHLEVDPIFNTFDKDFFYNNLLPDQISHKYKPKKYSLKKDLETQLQVLFEEIKRKKHRREFKEFTHFEILKKDDFNKKEKSGCLILKFKDHPFVVKVFMENPRSFVRPYSKGFCPIFFFNMGGGINRHLLGFTRIKNLYEIKKTIEEDPHWSKLISTPRKWFWIPKDCNQMELVGKNFGKRKPIKRVIPGTYCIIADAIKLKNTTFSLLDGSAKEMCMSLCNFLDVRIDPHIDNFLLEKGTDKIVIIDTEHFPSIVGFKERRQFRSYFSWYYQLSVKCLNDMFFQTKKERFTKT